MSVVLFEYVTRFEGDSMVGNLHTFGSLRCALLTVRFGSIPRAFSGSIWVPPEPIRIPVHLSGFQPGGGLLGSVMVPPVRILDIGSDYLLGLHRDRLEVESVRLFRFERS